jgi:16S rRNA (adenine1518-N6/adenine1519-N6)-dimethyltransferase
VTRFRPEKPPTVRRTIRVPAYVRDKAAAEGSELSRIKRVLAERIVDHCHLREDDVVVEIGPGAGALTGRIARRVREVIAVEKDAGLAELLREELAEWGRVEVVEGDFLEFDLAAAAAARGVQRLAVVGNIPYNITTPILERIFEQRAAVRSAVMLVQKEYAERLSAAAGTPEYGSLTLFARYYSLMEPLMTLKASAFWPRPTVDSMLVRFFLREKPPVEVPSEALLFRIIRGSFQMRRKQLFNTLEEALGISKEGVARLCRAAGVDPRRRGETLTLEEFAKLAREAGPD